MSKIPRTARSTLPSRSLLTLPRRSLNSLRSRGLKPTVRYVRAYAEEALFDLRYGVRTDRWVEVGDLEVVGDNKDLAGSYVPIKVLAFRSAIDFFQIPSEGVFVDYGSGKGRVLMLAGLYGFHRTVGIEFALNLCQEAEANLDKFRARTGKDFESCIVNVDAACYPVNDDECVFFFYNPFKSKLLEKVLSNIRLSLQSKPRLIHIVYANPIHRQVLDDDPFWRLVAETTSGGLDTFLYYQPR